MLSTTETLPMYGELRKIKYMCYCMVQLYAHSPVTKNVCMQYGIIKWMKAALLLSEGLGLEFCLCYL